MNILKEKVFRFVQVNLEELDGLYDRFTGTALLFVVTSMIRWCQQHGFRLTTVHQWFPEEGENARREANKYPLKKELGEAVKSWRYNIDGEATQQYYKKHSCLSSYIYSFRGNKKQALF